jgi:hypothetical protein
MGETIPPFGEAIRILRGMLRKTGFEDPLPELLWLTREDFYAVRYGWYYYTPRPSCSPAMFNQYYEAGRARGLVSVRALFCQPGIVACTVWYPQGEADAVQGWNYGLKVSIPRPLGIGTEVRSNFRWKLHTLSPQFRKSGAFERMAPSVVVVRG